MALKLLVAVSLLAEWAGAVWYVRRHRTELGARKTVASLGFFAIANATLLVALFAIVP